MALVAHVNVGALVDGSPNTLPIVLMILATVAGVEHAIEEFPADDPSEVTVVAVTATARLVTLWTFNWERKLFQDEQPPMTHLPDIDKPE